jgi:transcription termination factor Rho
MSEESLNNKAPLGLIEVLSNGAAFIRRPEAGYTPGKRDVYVGPKLVRKYRLRTGDEIAGVVGKRPKNGKSAPLVQLERVNGSAPESLGHRPDFKNLGAQHPEEPLHLECDRTYRGQPDYANRIIDLLCPFGKGQRALIVAPPKAGKTLVLQSVAQGVATNHPECKLYLVLVDERPEVFAGGKMSA